MGTGADQEAFREPSPLQRFQELVDWLRNPNEEKAPEKDVIEMAVNYIETAQRFGFDKYQTPVTIVVGGRILTDAMDLGEEIHFMLSQQNREIVYLRYKRATDEELNPKFKVYKIDEKGKLAIQLKEPSEDVELIKVECSGMMDK